MIWNRLKDEESEKYSEVKTYDDNFDKYSKLFSNMQEHNGDCPYGFYEVKFPSEIYITHILSSEIPKLFWEETTRVDPNDVILQNVNYSQPDFNADNLENKSRDEKTMFVYIFRK